ncbi:MAG: Asp23/Gls24 family envelope stress response protein [Clostridia bacterium]|nr:Asp23/Gls24 family envelope stress response protein [Clostridia bacterium]
MKLYTLVGKSGTGKSYQAMNLCKELNIPAIIDDGLFICDNQIQAGISAKRQETKIGAVKTALFVRDDHCESVSEKIREVNPEAMLVIGTSDGMTDKIIERLGLPHPERRIYIEDITTPAERELASKQRYQQGKHVIPAPSFQLKKDFSGYFLYPLQMLRGRRRADAQERSVVRPTYSYLGDFIISEKVMSDIIQHLAGENMAIASANRVIVGKEKNGLTITVQIVAVYGYRILESIEEFQKSIAEKISYMTAFNINAVNVEVKGLKREGE